MRIDAQLTRRMLGAAVAMALVGSVTGCSSGDTSASDIKRTGKQIAVGTAKTGLLRATPQRTDGTFVLIDEAVLPKAGYVVIYADGNGAPGRQLGVSGLLKSGTTKNVRVKVSPHLTSRVSVHAMLHAEDNKNKTFDFPKHDAPVGSKSGVIETAIKVEVKKP